MWSSRTETEVWLWIYPLRMDGSQKRAVVIPVHDIGWLEETNEGQTMMHMRDGRTYLLEDTPNQIGSAMGLEDPPERRNSGR